MHAHFAPVRTWLGRAASAARTLGRRPGVGSQAVSAWLTGPSCAMVRIDPAVGSGRPRLTVAQRADGGWPRTWKALAQGSTPVLVLPTAERHLLTVDRPQVPDTEVAIAVRWPAAAAQELDPDQLLCMPLALPASSAAVRDQMLVVSAGVDPVKKHLAQLREIGIDVRSVDVIDSALLGMLRLQADPHQACVVLAPAGHSLCIGLMWQGRFCAVRTLGLPSGHPREDRDYCDNLALHVQRTVDLFERQATLLAIHHVLLGLPSLSAQGRQAVASALPLPSRLFQLEDHLDIDAPTQATLAGDDDLHALACVAAFRLLGPAPQTAPDSSPREQVWTIGGAPPSQPPLPADGSGTGSEPADPLAPAPAPESEPAMRPAGQTTRPAEDWALQP